VTLLLAPETARGRLARFLTALRAWWPQNVTVDDPADSSLAGWLKPQRYVAWGIAIIAVVFGGLVLWNATTDLERGAIGDAVVQPELYRQVVSSRSAALVHEVMVSQNQHVKAGEPLLTLDPIPSESNRRILERKHWAEQARIARLTAIRDGGSAITFPKDLLEFAAQDDEIAATLAAARKAFVETRDSLDQRVGQVRSQQRQAEEAILGQRAQRTQLVIQLQLIQKELDGVITLIEQGLQRRPKLYELQRTKASLEGNISSTDATIARLQVQQGELELHAQKLIGEERDSANKQLNEAWSADFEYVDRLKAATSLVELTVLRAPQSGRVLSTRVTNVGAVVRADEPLVEIVPDEGALMLKVVVPPQDINDVGPGTEARISIHGGGRGLRRLEGRVINISPDLVPHPRLPTGTYVADVEISPGSLSADGRKRLQAGMPATVKLITGHRSVWTYMTEGLTDALRGHQALMQANETAPAHKPAQ
jgi:HlyD family type I secretion membrane fusion protein